MGWLFTSGATRSKIVNENTQPWENDKTIAKCLTYCLRGNCLWMVWELTDKATGKTEKYIGLDLLQAQRGYGWGYKGMSESVHPYYYTCPLSYLSMVPVANAEWRAKVLLYHNQGKDCKVGDTISLIGADIPFITLVEKRGKVWFGEYNGIRYKVPKRMMGEKRIDTVPS